MKENKKIGELIKEEGDKQGLSAEEFAKLISCKRQNVYKIYKKNSLDTALLGRISNVLGKNFFLDISKDITLSGVDDEKALQEIYNRMAVSQFMEVVPDILGRLGHPTAIFIMSRPADYPSDMPMPDYYIGEYSPIISFSVGDTMRDKLRRKYKEDKSYPSSRIISYTEEQDGLRADLVKMECYGPDILDIKLDYKTEQEWESLLRLVFSNFIKGKNKVVSKYDIIYG